MDIFEWRSQEKVKKENALFHVQPLFFRHVFAIIQQKRWEQQGNGKEKIMTILIIWNKKNSGRLTLPEANPPVADVS